MKFYIFSNFRPLQRNFLQKVAAPAQFCWLHRFYQSFFYNKYFFQINLAGSLVLAPFWKRGTFEFPQFWSKNRLSPKMKMTKSKIDFRNLGNSGTSDGGPYRLSTADFGFENQISLWRHFSKMAAFKVFFGFQGIFSTYGHDHQVWMHSSMGIYGRKGCQSQVLTSRMRATPKKRKEMNFVVAHYATHQWKGLNVYTTIFSTLPSFTFPLLRKLESCE